MECELELLSKGYIKVQPKEIVRAKGYVFFYTEGDEREHKLVGFAGAICGDIEKRYQISIYKIPYKKSLIFMVCKKP